MNQYPSNQDPSNQDPSNQDPSNQDPSNMSDQSDPSPLPTTVEATVSVHSLYFRAKIGTGKSAKTATCTSDAIGAAKAAAAKWFNCEQVWIHIDVKTAATQSQKGVYHCSVIP
jgi:hypothetical protein